MIMARSAQTSSAQAPVQLQALLTHEALDAYLRIHADKPTPLDALPPLARQRFLDSLVFGRGGLSGFDTSDLAAELTPEQIARVLALFDAQDYARAVQSRHPSGNARWRAQAADPGQIEPSFDALYRLQSTKDVDALRTTFKTDFAPLLGEPAMAATLPDRELIYLLRAIEMVSSDSPTADDAKWLQNVVTVLQAREIVRPQDVRAVYDMLLGRRQFDAARRHASGNPNAGLPDMPKLVDPYSKQAPAFTVWHTDGTAGNTVIRTALDLGPTQILVTAGCHFSQDAAEDIASDPVLGPATDCRSGTRRPA